MKKQMALWLVLACAPAHAQFPPLEISIDDVTAITNSTVEVSVRAGVNWQNITQVSGSIGFDDSLIDSPQLVYWGLTNPSGALIQDMGGGVLTFAWMSLITIGPTLNAGDRVFTLRFDVNEVVGQSSLDFGSVPQPLFWANGVGWSGTNFTLLNGSVSVIADLVFGDGFEP